MTTPPTGRATRVAPGLVVSTIPDGDRTQSVVFTADPDHRTGANVTAVSYVDDGDVETHHAATVMAVTR